MKTSTLIVLGLGLAGVAYLLSQPTAGAIAPGADTGAGDTTGQGGNQGGTPFGGGTAFGTGTQFNAVGHGTQVMSISKGGLVDYPYFVGTGGGFRLMQAPY